MRRAILEFIDRYWRANHCPPTIREIGAGVGINSTSHVLFLLRGLAAEGKMKGTPRGPVPVWVVEAINAQKAA